LSIELIIFHFKTLQIPSLSHPSYSPFHPYPRPKLL